MHQWYELVLSSFGFFQRAEAQKEWVGKQDEIQSIILPLWLPSAKASQKKVESRAAFYSIWERNESRKSWAFSHFNGYSSFWLLWWSSSLSLPSRLKPCLANVPETKKGPMVFLIRSCSFIGRTCFSEFPGAAFVPRCFLYTFLL